MLLVHLVWYLLKRNESGRKEVRSMNFREKDMDQSIGLGLHFQVNRWDELTDL